jgi:hypothetical protein
MMSRRKLFEFGNIQSIWESLVVIQDCTAGPEKRFCESGPTAAIFGEGVGNKLRCDASGPDCMQ